MRLLTILQLFFLVCSCEQQDPNIKSHEVLVAELPRNYQAHRQIFQRLAKQVAAFKIIRSIDFAGGTKSFGPVPMYCAPLDSLGFSIGSNDYQSPFSDPRFKNVLQQEGIREAEIRKIKALLDSVNCHRFYSYSNLNPETGTHYIDIEFKYNASDGVQQYYYKFFNKRLEPNQVEFFDRTKVRYGSYTGIGAVLDTNAVWYFPID